MMLVQASLGVKNVRESTFHHCGGPVNLVLGCLSARKDRESRFHLCGGLMKLVKACLRLRDTARARVVTVYSKFTYARYNFHLKQPRLGMYFFQPNIEFSSYVYEAV